MTRGGSERSRIGTVLLVLLVVLAGCTGGGGAADGGGDGAADGDSTPGGSGDATGSAGPDASGDGPTDAPGDGSTDGGDGDSAELEARYDEYASNLRELGSYTATYTWATEGDDAGANSSFQGVARVDLEAESAYVVQTSVSGGQTNTAELFWPEGEDVVYTRIEVGETAFYRQSSREQSMLTLWTDPLLGSDTVPNAGASVGTGTVGAYRDEGIVSTADGPRHRYVITDVTAASVEGYSGEEVTDYYTEVLVDDEREIVTDYVVQVTYAGTNGTAGIESFAFELTYRDVGSTTVPTPEWLAEAKAQTG